MGDSIDYLSAGSEITIQNSVGPKISAASDKGMIELFDGDWLEPVARVLEKMEGY